MRYRDGRIQGTREISFVRSVSVRVHDVSRIRIGGIRSCLLLQKGHVPVNRAKGEDGKVYERTEKSPR